MVLGQINPLPPILSFLDGVIGVICLSLSVTCTPLFFVSWTEHTNGIQTPIYSNLIDTKLETRRRKVARRGNGHVVGEIVLVVVLAGTGRFFHWLVVPVVSAPEVEGNSRKKSVFSLSLSLSLPLSPLSLFFFFFLFEGVGREYSPLPQMAHHQLHARKRIKHAT